MNYDERDAEVARLRAELADAGKMGRELFQQRNRALDALRLLYTAAERSTPDRPDVRWHLDVLRQVRAVLADHDREARDG